MDFGSSYCPPDLIQPSPPNPTLSNHFKTNFRQLWDTLKTTVCPSDTDTDTKAQIFISWRWTFSTATNDYIVYQPEFCTKPQQDTTFFFFLWKFTSGCRLVDSFRKRLKLGEKGFGKLFSHQPFSDQCQSH